LSINCGSALSDEDDHARDGPEHDKDEQACRQIEQRDQSNQITQRSRPVFPDRERHRSERAERGGFHDDADHPENGMREFIDRAAKPVASLTHAHQSKAEQHREQQHL
jgi:hypothetical protein